MSVAVFRARAVDVVLLVLAVGLVIAVVATRSKVTTRERESRSQNLLTAWREVEVSGLSYQRAEEQFRLERRPMAEASADDEPMTTWYLAEPYDEEVDPFSIEKLLGTLQHASFERAIRPEEIDRAAFGMDEPRMVLEIEMGEIVYRLRLGADAASPPGSAYMEVTGEGAPRKGIFIVRASLIEELTLGAETFRERHVLPYLSPALSSFRLEGAGGERALRRASWGGWRFDGMQGDVRAGRQELDRLVVQFARAVADELIEPEIARQVLADAQETVVIHQIPKRPDLQPGKVEIGGSCPGDPDRIVALRMSPDQMAGCVTRSVWPGLTLPAEAIVDRSLFYMRRDEVEGLEVRRGDKTMRLERQEDGFVMREPKQGEVDAEAGEGRLESIIRAMGRRVEAPDRAALGLDPPAGSVVLRSSAASDEDVRVETVELGTPRKDGVVFARRVHDDVVLELGSEAMRIFTPDAALIRSRHVFDLRADSVRRVAVSGAVEQVVVRDGQGALSLEVPEGFGVDAGLAMEIIDGLRTLTAERWVSDADDGSFGLGEPTLRVRLTTKVDDGDETERTVLIGRPTTSGHFASVEADGGVFVMPRRLFEALTTLAIDRTVFGVDPTLVQVVELRAVDRFVELERIGQTFVQTGGEELGPAAIQRVVDALSTLRAEAAVQLGRPRPEHGLGAPLLTVRMRLEPALPGSERPRTWKVGAGDTWRGMSVYYAEASEVGAVYVLARSQVQAIFDAL